MSNKNTNNEKNLIEEEEDPYNERIEKTGCAQENEIYKYVFMINGIGVYAKKRCNAFGNVSPPNYPMLVARS
ncbi:unnamed protein product [Cunninghamella blakesleeana]